ncbi:hypothetical protein ACVQ90_14010 [Staphylococcus aureus]
MVNALRKLESAGVCSEYFSLKLKKKNS